MSIEELYTIDAREVYEDEYQIDEDEQDAIMAATVIENVTRRYGANSRITAAIRYELERGASWDELVHIDPMLEFERV